MTSNPFQKATRAQLKARVALEGPTGAGKTWTALEWATVLAAGGNVAVVDTERGSASLYSDHFDFDVLTFEPPYEPPRLTEILKAAETHGYAVVVIDSLSHFWEGEGGTLDMVDAAAARSRSGNKFSEGWKVATPALRHLVDTMLGLDAHLIATMRSKMEYILTENDRGQKVPTKVGMAPVMRAGVEYEFTLVGDLDLEHRLTITKSRCDLLADQVVQPKRAGEAAEAFMGWLGQGEPLADRDVVDDLKERLNALPKELGARGAFKAALGHPDHLRASQVSAAESLVARYENGGGDGGTSSQGSTAAAPPPDSPGGGEQDPPPAPAAGAVTVDMLHDAVLAADPSRDTERKRTNDILRAAAIAAAPNPGPGDIGALIADQTLAAAVHAALADRTPPDGGNKASGPDDPEVAPSDGGEPQEAGEGGARDAAVPSPAAADDRSRALQRQGILAGEIWGKEAGHKRHLVIDYMFGHDSATKCTDDELGQLNRQLERIRDGLDELHLRGNGEWTVRVRPALGGRAA